MSESNGEQKSEVVTEGWYTDIMPGIAFAYYHPGCITLSPFIKTMARHDWWRTHEWNSHHVVRQYHIYPARRIHETIECCVCGKVLREKEAQPVQQ